MNLTMALEFIKVEIVHKEKITPSSPTPQSLKSFTISVFDQFSPYVYFPLLLFYPYKSDPQCLVAERTQRTNLLKRSLSETLTHFYPFAGRIHDQFSIFCDDQGAVFVEAHVKCSISSVLSKLDPQFLKEMIPKLETTKEEEEVCPLLNVQANFFDCGGIALGFNVCHKTIDAFTLSTFINNWSANYSMHDEIVSLIIPSPPYVGAASFFPPLELFKPTPQFGEVFKVKCITKRFVFESSNVARLQSKATSAAVTNPTRVEAVSSLIWKIAMKVSSKNAKKMKEEMDYCVRASSSTWLQIVNMRNVTKSCRKDLMGNMLGFFAARSSGSNDDIRGLVAAMRKGSTEFKAKYGREDVSVEDVSEIMKEYGEEMKKGSDGDEECYCSTSWCRFPFYEADFGWGKPLMNLPATVELKNLVTLTDTSDGGGVEARLTLKEKDMVIFEMDEELIAFASINPALA